MATVRQLLDSKGADLVTVERGDTVLAAARVMNAHRIGCVVVTDGDALLGILTERDILARVVAMSRDPATTLVADVMTTRVITCTPDATPSECVRRMTDQKFRHLPVVSDGALCGMITSGDILAYRLQGQRDTIEYLSRQAFDPRPRRESSAPPNKHGHRQAS